MSFSMTVPISTEVLNSNPDCRFSGSYDNGSLVIEIDTRCQNVHQRLGLSKKTKIHWGAKHQFDVQELSALAWPIRYRVLTRSGYYLGADGQRVHLTTAAHGLDARRGVSLVLMRAAILLIIVGGVGCRRATFLLKELFHAEVSKSSLHRWIEEVAETLPSGDEMIRALNQKQPITEAHFDEIFPRGTNACVLVLKDEHGRIIATEEVDRRDEASVRPFLERMKALGLNLGAFYIDGCKTYYAAIRSVFGEAVAIQYDYFHILQNVWRHLWKYAVARRRDLKKRIEDVTTPWYKRSLTILAQRLWKDRYLMFTADERLAPEQRERLVELIGSAPHVGKLREFLEGVRRMFTDSTTQEEARQALQLLKRQKVDREYREPFDKVLGFLEENFEWMTAYLRHDGVKRNSLAESGMRILRRLEVEHDGFRSPGGRERCLRIYQAVRYLDWKVHQLPEKSADST